MTAEGREFKARCDKMTTEELAEFVQTEREAGRLRESMQAWSLYSARPDYQQVSDARFEKLMAEMFGE